MHEKTKAKALKTLDGMETIARNDRLVYGEYVSDYVDYDSKNSVCEGRKYCLLGTAWTAHGAPLRRHPLIGNGWVREGVLEGDREAYLARRPALRAVYAALNTAAERRLARRKLSHYQEEDLKQYESPAEGYFEVIEPGRSEVVRLIDSARKIVEAI